MLIASALYILSSAPLKPECTLQVETPWTWHKQGRCCRGDSASCMSLLQTLASTGVGIWSQFLGSAAGSAAAARLLPAVAFLPLLPFAAAAGCWLAKRFCLQSRFFACRLYVRLPKPGNWCLQNSFCQQDSAATSQLLESSYCSTAMRVLLPLMLKINYV